jgi:hypothetical protein
MLRTLPIKHVQISKRQRGRHVIVNDKMQQGYSYRLVEPIGRNLDPEFKPELTPQAMLALGVFGGKYLTDCRDEFPASWWTCPYFTGHSGGCSLS